MHNIFFFSVTDPAYDFFGPLASYPDSDILKYQNQQPGYPEDYWVADKLAFFVSFIIDFLLVKSE